MLEATATTVVEGKGTIGSKVPRKCKRGRRVIAVIEENGGEKREIEAIIASSEPFYCLQVESGNGRQGGLATRCINLVGAGSGQLYWDVPLDQVFIPPES